MLEACPNGLDLVHDGLAWIHGVLQTLGRITVTTGRRFQHHPELPQDCRSRLTGHI